MISLIVLTYRPGGIDILADCLSRTQNPKGIPWELVVIDDYPGRVERGVALKYLQAAKIPVGYYGVSKPKSYPQTKSGLANATNTALFHAKGDYLVFCSDYCFLRDAWLMLWEHWRKVLLATKTLLSGVAIEYDAPKPTGPPDDIKTWAAPAPITAKKPWVPRVFETFYYGAPLEFFLETNGLDERSDHCHCWPVTSTMAHAAKLGYSLEVRDDMVVDMIEHRSWDFEMVEKSPVVHDAGLWRIDEKQSMEKEPDWIIPAPNPFDLRYERRKVALDLTPYAEATE